MRVNGEWRDDLPNAKLTGYRVRKGDAFMVRSGGGGGFGDPCERDVADVAFDLREGYITAAAAERDYGVVVNAQTGEVDEEASRKRRAAR